MVYIFSEPFDDFGLVSPWGSIEHSVDRIGDADSQILGINKGNGLNLIKIKDNKPKLKLILESAMIGDKYQASEQLQAINLAHIIPIPTLNPNIGGRFEYFHKLILRYEEGVTNWLEQTIVLFYLLEGTWVERDLRVTGWGGGHQGLLTAGYRLEEVAHWFWEFNLGYFYEADFWLLVLGQDAWTNWRFIIYL